MNNEFQVYYSPTDCEGLNDMMNETLAKFPGMRKTIRTVDSLNALREKIYIFEDGLNDIAIELSKVVIKYDKQNSIHPKSELRFEKMIADGKDSSNGKLIFRQIIDGQPQKGMILFDKVNYDNFVTEVTTNDKFKMQKYCDTIDEKWILTHFA